MRILFVISWMDVGGSATLARELLTRLRARGHTAEGIVAEVKGDELKNVSEWQNMAFKGNPWSPLCAIPAVTRLKSRIFEMKAHVVHSFLLNADILSGLACTGTGIPHLSYILDRRNWLMSRKPKQMVKKVLLRSLFRRARTKFTAISQSAADYTASNLGVSPDKIRVARNAVDTTSYYPREHKQKNGKDFRIGTLSRIVAEKGLPQLVLAAHNMKERGVSFRIFIAGRGSDEQMLRAKIKDYGLSEKVELVGAINDPGDFYSGLDAFVVPSVDSEGLPTTILEAMATGLPVVATDVGGAREAVLDGRTGVLVAPSDPEALAAVLTELALDKERCISMGLAGRRRVEEGFSYARLMTELESAYADLAAGQWR